MQLIQPLEKHLIEMMSWFANEQALTDWSGPNFRYPFSQSSFAKDLKVTVLKSFVLVTDENELLAFGQYYNRLDKCHLSRLIVNPKLRGRGLASELIHRLCVLGTKELEVTECSLFVLSHNSGAIKAYEKFGFSFTHYPDDISLPNCLYMVKH